MYNLKIVIDTNVVVSSIWGGKPREVINLWRDKKINLILSESIMREYLKVISGFNLTEGKLGGVGLLFSEPERVEIVKPKKSFKEIKEDPEDNKFLDCAVEGKANYIVSGNHHLQDLKEFKGIKILSPDEFLKEIKKTT